MSSLKRLTVRKLITYFGTLPCVLIPVAALAVVRYLLLGDGVLTILYTTLIIISIGLSYGIGSFVKLVFFKARPHPQEFTTRREKIEAGSFPSIHTANATIILGFSFVLFVESMQAMQTTGTGYPLAFLAIIMIALLFYSMIGLSRVVLKKHFPADVRRGTAFGLIITCVVIRQAPLIGSILDFFFHLGLS